MQIGAACEKIPYRMQDSACRKRIVKSAKIIEELLNTFEGSRV